jgi:DNA-binding Lrp family transcriptional regulator
MPTSRLPRFQRVPHLPRIELTARDREILRQVRRHRFLRSSQIVSLLGGSRQHVIRRLQLLFHHGYLERPRAQIDYFHRGGSQSIAYGLGSKGARWLARELSLPRRADWGASNRTVGRLFLEHALLTSEIMVTLEVACRRHRHLRLLGAEELPLPKGVRGKREPFRWNVRLADGTKVGLIPDRVFGLELTQPGKDPIRAYFFLEADRATMPIVRPTLSRSSIQRKLLAYEATWSQGLHRSLWGFHRFRVLTVTTSPGRVKNLVEACRGLARGQGLFLFTAAAALRTATDPLALMCEAARADHPESLLDSLSPVPPRSVR